MARRWLIILLGVLVAALLVVIGVTVFGHDGGGSSASTGAPRLVSARELSDLAANADTPVYWLGRRGDASYELTETSSGRVYVRYLTPGAQAGDKRAAFVTVGTYSEDGGVAALRRAAASRKGARLGRTDDGAVLLIDPSSPDNAHLAYPAADLQIEVYSPVPGEALRLASHGDVKPIP